jgi:hypothetical protein
LKGYFYNLEKSGEKLKTLTNIIVFFSSFLFAYSSTASSSVYGFNLEHPVQSNVPTLEFPSVQCKNDKAIIVASLNRLRQWLFGKHLPSNESVRPQACSPGVNLRDNRIGHQVFGDQPNFFEIPSPNVCGFTHAVAPA